MKRLCFIAAAAGLFLVSNAPPPRDSEERAYPPCSARVTDNCVQRIREPESRALDAMPPAAESGPRERPHHPAPVAAAAPRKVYPPCTASRQDSCTQVRSQTRYGHARPKYRVAKARHARSVRRAGERG